MTNPSKPVAQLTGGGGSGFGISYWKDMFGCGKRLQYDQEARERGETWSIGKSADIGTVFHALAELSEKKHLGQKVVDTDTELTKIIPYSQRASSVIAEGTRVYQAYRAKVPPGFWGRAEAIEEILPATDEQMELVQDYFETVHPVTTKPDMIVEVDTDAIYNKFKLKLRAGYYDLDYKTMGGIPTDRSKYDLSLSLKLYRLVWDLLNPDKKLRGSIALMISRAKEPRIVPHYVPNGPVEADRKLLKAFFKSAADAMYSPRIKNDESTCGWCRYLYNPCERY